MGDLAITIPASRRVELANEAHLRRLAPDFRPVVGELLSASLAEGWPLGIVQSRRTSKQQLELFLKGRRLIGGQWVIVQTGDVVTKARTVEDTAHGCICGFEHDDANPDDGCAYAVDLCFLRDGRVVGPTPGKGNDSYDAELPWESVIGRLVDATPDLYWGGHFDESRPGAGDGFDLGHVQARRWRALRADRAAALRLRS